MNKKYVASIILGILLVVIVTVTAKSNNPAYVKSEKLQAATSFYPLYFFTSSVGGNKADVANITPAGAEPHDYEPTAQDIAKIESSDLLVLNGGGLEAWGDNIKNNINKDKTILVIAGDGLTNKEVVEDGEKMTDPHVWLSPLLAKKMVAKIAEGFAATDQPNKSYYLANADSLEKKLDNLDNAYKEGLKNCGERNIITSHAAFGYLAEAYGLTQVPITGLSPDAEPSPKELMEIAKFAKSNNIKYIFFESLASPKLSETIASEVGAKTLVLNPIEGLINEELAAGKNYFTEMQNNLDNLRIALGCK